MVAKKKARSLATEIQIHVLSLPRCCDALPLLCAVAAAAAAVRHGRSRSKGGTRERQVSVGEREGQDVLCELTGGRVGETEAERGDSTDLVERPYYGSERNMLFGGMGGFWFQLSTKHKNQLQVQDGPITFYPMTQTKHTLTSREGYFRITQPVCHPSSPRPTHEGED